MRKLISLAVLTLSLSAFAQQRPADLQPIPEPPPPPAGMTDDPIEPQVTITKKGEDKVEEFRANGKLPDDPVLHQCVVAYASDISVLDTSLRPHGLSASLGEVFMASLDHAMWFHRPFRADEWLLYAQDTPSASGGRGLGRGLIYTREGALAASVVQEGVIRPARWAR